MSSSPFFSNFDVDGLINDVLSGAPKVSTAARVNSALERFNAATPSWRTCDRVFASLLLRLLAQGHFKRRGAGLLKRYLMAGMVCEGVNAVLHPQEYAEYRMASKVLFEELVTILKTS